MSKPLLNILIHPHPLVLSPKYFANGSGFSSQMHSMSMYLIHALLLESQFLDSWVSLLLQEFAFFFHTFPKVSHISPSSVEFGSPLLQSLHLHSIPTLNKCISLLPFFFTHPHFQSTDILSFSLSFLKEAPTVFLPIEQLGLNHLQAKVVYIILLSFNP